MLELPEILLHPYSLIAFLLFIFVTKWFFITTGNKNLPPSPLKIPVVGNLLQISLGKKYTEGYRGRKFKKQLEEYGVVLGVFNVEDFIPWLDWINYLTGLNARVERVFKEFDSFLDEVVDESEAKRVEWTMTKLIKHPQVMKKARDEMRRITGSKHSITKDDLEKMLYLKVVIKESLRLRPPIPLLIPRESSMDVKVQGYGILAKPRVMVNAWKIGRDPSSWEELEEFRPERFLDSAIDFKGNDFQLIPFGVWKARSSRNNMCFSP
ncbi:unnamed protein product [Dovyalis caffra]|uniref:Cytochrome P450 n=1 Tax=Dovyalis caffra TaxID=77055 RepID=A0AAV1QXD8_9ROSI|nr:unnamed protein product [Dovyalis caffra]